MSGSNTFPAGFNVPITFPRASVDVLVSECELSTGLCTTATLVGGRNSFNAISERARVYLQ